jgi:hypothetical protein
MYLAIQVAVIGFASKRFRFKAVSIHLLARHMNRYSFSKASLAIGMAATCAALLGIGVAPAMAGGSAGGYAKIMRQFRKAGIASPDQASNPSPASPSGTNTSTGSSGMGSSGMGSSSTGSSSMGSSSTTPSGVNPSSSGQPTDELHPEQGQPGNNTAR